MLLFAALRLLNVHKLGIKNVIYGVPYEGLPPLFEDIQHSSPVSMFSRMVQVHIIAKSGASLLA